MRTRTSILAVASLALAAPVFATDPVSKMYDLRDLAAVLPQNTQAAAHSSDPFAVAYEPAARRVPILADIPLIGHAFTIRPDPSRGSAPASDPLGGGLPLDQGAGAPDPRTAGRYDLSGAQTSTGMSPTDELVNRLCGVLALSNAELVENVYFVEGEQDAHRKFEAAVESVRGLYQDRVQIEVSCYDVDAQQAISIGDAAPRPDKPAISAKIVGVRKTMTRVQATRSISYIARWTPIVADSAVALEPGAASVNEGLVLGVRVTSGGKDKQRVSVQGAITKAEISNVQVPAQETMASGATALSPGGPLVTIGLPRIDARTIDTDVDLELNRATVVAIVPGFKEGRQIVVEVTLKNAE